jgi:hypothetical protein
LNWGEIANLADKRFVENESKNPEGSREGGTPLSASKGEYRTVVCFAHALRRVVLQEKVGGGGAAGERGNRAGQLRSLVVGILRKIEGEQRDYAQSGMINLRTRIAAVAMAVAGQRRLS